MEQQKWWIIHLSVWAEVATSYTSSTDKRCYSTAEPFASVFFYRIRNKWALNHHSEYLFRGKSAVVAFLFSITHIFSILLGIWMTAWRSHAWLSNLWSATAGTRIHNLQCVDSPSVCLYSVLTHGCGGSTFTTSVFAVPHFKGMFGNMIAAIHISWASKYWWVI